VQSPVTGSLALAGLTALAERGTKDNNVRLANALADRLGVEENPKRSAAMVATIFALPMDCASRPPLAKSDLLSFLTEFQIDYRRPEEAAVFARLAKQLKCAQTPELMFLLHSFDGLSIQGRDVLEAALRLKFSEPADSDFWHTMQTVKSREPIAFRVAARDWQ
jgi:hypothetical protein